ncbi:MAG: efflux RND transporter periplasmic adaptor subunit [Pseudomonadales bacterium]|nr:efflux RND transporter periplasmic adaptor subunit [Pseudomonadales bacterium]
MSLFSRRSLFLVAGVTIASLTIASSYFPHHSSSANVVPPQISARIEPLEITISAIGQLKPAAKATVSQMLSGRIDKVFKREGDKVHAGEIVARVDPVLQQLDIRALEHKLKSYQAMIQRREAELARIRVKRDAANELAKTEGISKIDFEQIKADFAIAYAHLNQARALKEEVAAELAQEKIKLELTNITSPIDGTVLTVSAHAGQMVDPGLGNNNLMSVADISRLRIEALVTEADVIRLSPGMPARATMIADPKIQRMVEISEIQPVPVEVNDATLYVVELSLDNADGSLMIEMSARVDFILEYEPEALVVPREAVGHINGKSIVAQANGDDHIFIPVETGKESRLKVSILSGLSEGQKILAPFPRQE